MGKYLLPRFADQIVYRARCFECHHCEGWNAVMGQFDCKQEDCVGQLRRVVPIGPEHERARHIEESDTALLNELSSIDWGDSGHSECYKQAVKSIHLLQAGIKRISPGKCYGLYEGQILGWWIDEDTKELVLRYREGAVQ